VRLSQRLLLGALILVGVLVVVIAVLLDRRLYARITEQTVRELASEARFVATQWTPAVNPDALANTAGAALGHRVTLIDPAGHVTGDSEFDGDALARLENHASRPEVIQARATGMGSARRTSPSEGDQELYVAVRASLGIARVSVATRTLDELFAASRRDVFAAGAIALLAALVLASALARTFSRSIIDLRDVAQAMAAGDLTRRPVLTAPGEVGDLATALHRMAEQLEGRLASLQNEDALLAAVIESLNEGILAVDERQQIIRINEVARQLFAVPEPVPFAADRLPRDRALREALGAALGGAPTGPVEVGIGERTLSLTAEPLPGGGAVLAVYDLTTIRRLETIRRDFVANVSHELRTPLTVVGGFAETLATDDPPPARRKQFAEAIHASTVRMQRIVDDLLDLSRIESGGWRPVPVDADVRAAAAESAAPATATAAAKGVTLEVAVRQDAATVRADPTALRQILGNLIDNAVRHTHAGTVTVFTEAGEGGTWVGVSDTGIGIAPEHLPRIFERFYRVDPARSREAGGTGLGLAIVKHLVDAHGGRVRAESIAGKGTTIAAFFPDTSP
jgi:two-component system phosphate regulon sensor histidine kinase PhoR